jgi:hypothetical protein
LSLQTFNDTRSAIQQISQIINENIPNESSAPKMSSTSLKTKAKLAAKPNGTGSEAQATTMTTTTTEAPEFKLTRPLLLSLVRRNVNGLVRLFNIEWRDAINVRASYFPSPRLIALPLFYPLRCNRLH